MRGMGLECGDCGRVCPFSTLAGLGLLSHAGIFSVEIRCSAPDGFVDLATRPLIVFAGPLFCSSQGEIVPE